MKSNIRIKNRLWILGKNGTLLGEGRVELLEKIDRFRSISEAAKSMNMSYLKAWKLIDVMNKVADKPLVLKKSGGKDGGGTYLTEEGRKAICFYRTLNQRCQDFLKKELDKVNW